MIPCVTAVTVSGVRTGSSDYDVSAPSAGLKLANGSMPIGEEL